MSQAVPRPPSALTAFGALCVFSFRRQLQIRQMAWVSLGLLAVLTITVGVLSHGPKGWGLGERYSWRYRTRYSEFPVRLAEVQSVAITPDATSAASVAFAPFRALLSDEKFLSDWAFLNFSRWVVFVMYLNFLLPLFTLAYASGAIGSERESRTLIWLLTRPLPRWAVYLAKFFGMLPWCVVVSLGGLAILCFAGGELGRRAFAVYWPAALVGTVSLAALFHLVGAVFRRPAVVGLVYIFFFEMLVANLPGSLKEFSLNFYTRSLMYNAATQEVASVSPESLDVYAPSSSGSAWLMLLLVSVGVSALGIWCFGRQEPQDET